MHASSHILCTQRAGIHETWTWGHGLTGGFMLGVCAFLFVHISVCSHGIVCMPGQVQDACAGDAHSAGVYHVAPDTSFMILDMCRNSCNLDKTCCILSEMTPTPQGVAVTQCHLGWRTLL
jgi:hypothetical protein